MARFSLSSYTLRVSDGSGSSVQLDDIGTGKDLFELLAGFLGGLKDDFSHDADNQKLLRVARLEKSERYLKGIIETGEYGYESTLYDVGQGQVSHQRKVTEAEMLPFYFVVKVPRDVQEGIVLLQRFKQFGIRKILIDSFDEYFSRECPGFRLAINPLVPEETVKDIIKKGRVMKVRLVRFSVPADIADAYDNPGPVEEGAGHVELSVVAKRKGGLPIIRRLLEVLGKTREINKLIELQHFEYENVKVEVNFGGIHRTIDLSKLNRFRAYFDISDQVKIGPGGHPAFENLDSIATGLLRDLAEAIGSGD
jgi:hypothetical protein